MLDSPAGLVLMGRQAMGLLLESLELVLRRVGLELQELSSQEMRVILEPQERVVMAEVELLQAEQTLE